jgi:DNA-binding XRE family transcriptional regulator
MIAAKERKTVRQLREEHGWKQIDLAYHAGISLSSVSNIEAGQQDPRISIARKIADALGVSVDAIEWVIAAERRPRKSGKQAQPAAE